MLQTTRESPHLTKTRSRHCGVVAASSGKDTGNGRCLHCARADMGAAVPPPSFHVPATCIEAEILLTPAYLITSSMELRRELFFMFSSLIITQQLRHTRPKPFLSHGPLHDDSVALPIERMHPLLKDLVAQALH